MRIFDPRDPNYPLRLTPDGGLPPGPIGGHPAPPPPEPPSEPYREDYRVWNKDELAVAGKDATGPDGMVPPREDGTAGLRFFVSLTTSLLAVCVILLSLVLWIHNYRLNHQEGEIRRLWDRALPVEIATDNNVPKP